MKRLMLTVVFLGAIFMTNARAQENLAKATLAGGCFWCMEPAFEELDGVKSVMAGYTGGEEVDPTYQEVSNYQTSHLEAVEIVYDPTKVSYETLLDIFWQNIDPTQKDGQFADVGPQYQTAIFFHDEQQKKVAEESKAKLGASGKFKKPIATRILEAKVFYPAEDYHQDYYKKNAAHYKQYKYFSGRQPFLEKTWGKKK